MSLTQRASSYPSRSRRAFTLVELLIVVAIIGILVAILFPVFSRARERGYQASCATNLQQIGLAVRAYYQDEKRYPSSLASLLPASQNSATTNITASNLLENTTGATNIGGDATNGVCGTNADSVAVCPNPSGGDYLKGANILLCPDDDNVVGSTPRSSYGDVSTGFPSARPALTGANANRFTWNYWGYDPQGFAYVSETEAEAAMTTLATAPAANPLLVNPTSAYGSSNRIKASMSNRFAPPTTIITHCIYHRLPTSNLNDPAYLYGTGNDDYDATQTSPDSDGSSAMDIVLRIDGSANVKGVGSWQALADGTSNWQAQNF